MTTNKKLIAFGTLCCMMAAPLSATAQSSYHHRQQKKNEWRNLAYGAGALGIYGLLKGDRNLAFAGLAGAGYSAWRYEQDRKAQSRMRSRTSAYYLRRRHR